MNNQKVSREKNGDDSMKEAMVSCPELDLNLILGKGAIISSHEALGDATQISWSEDVLNGDKKAIIKEGS